MKTIQTVKDKIAVELLKQEKTTNGGIIIPDSVDKDPQGYGEVVSVGEEVENIKVGDVIMFHKSAGMAIMIEKVIYKVLCINEIYGILKDV